MTFKKIALMVATGITVTCLSTPQASAQNEETLLFGIVPQQAASRLAKMWVPFINELSKETGYKIKFAAMMWDHIERIAKETNTTVQTAIAKRLDEEGHKSAEGAVISQSHVRRYIHGSGKHKKWEAIKQAMKDPELFDDQKKKP